MKQNQKTLTAQEALAENIVAGIKSKTISFGNPQKTVRKDGAKGESFVSAKNSKGAEVRVIRVRAKDAKHPRYSVEIVFPGKEKGTVRKALITGKYARAAYRALTYVPASKPVISEEDVALANAAFDF